MPAESKNIYGLDDNAMAQSISSDALSNTAGTEEYWAKSAVNQSARSKGNLGIPNNDVVTISDKADGRANSKSNH